MPELPPINVNLLAFFKTGRFDCIKLGDTKEMILSNCPLPDDYGIGNSIENAKIWVYGGVELHFNGPVLYLIYSDSLKELNSSNSILLDKWILTARKILTVQLVIKHLNNERIDFSKHTGKQFEECIIICLTISKIELKFLSEDNRGFKTSNPNLYRLYSFSLIDIDKSGLRNFPVV